MKKLQTKPPATKRRKGLSPHQAYKIAVKKKLSIRSMYKLIIGSKVP